jgi:hypothetical protein
MPDRSITSTRFDRHAMMLVAVMLCMALAHLIKPLLDVPGLELIVAGLYGLEALLEFLRGRRSDDHFDHWVR